MRYGHFQATKYLKDNGITRFRALIDKRNTTALQVSELDAVEFGEAYYLKILWWKSWKEKPISHK